jgi:hypothetical protein
MAILYIGWAAESVAFGTQVSEIEKFRAWYDETDRPDELMGR